MLCVISFLSDKKTLQDNIPLQLFLHNELPYHDTEVLLVREFSSCSIVLERKLYTILFALGSISHEAHSFIFP